MAAETNTVTAEADEVEPFHAHGHDWPPYERTAIDVRYGELLDALSERLPDDEGGKLLCQLDFAVGEKLVALENGILARMGGVVLLDAQGEPMATAKFDTAASGTADLNARLDRLEGLVQFVGGQLMNARPRSEPARGAPAGQEPPSDELSACACSEHFTLAKDHHDWILGFEERGVVGVSELFDYLELTADCEQPDPDRTLGWIDFPQFVAFHNWRDPVHVTRLADNLDALIRFRQKL